MKLLTKPKGMIWPQKSSVVEIENLGLGNPRRYEEINQRDEFLLSVLNRKYLELEVNELIRVNEVVFENYLEDLGDIIDLLEEVSNLPIRDYNYAEFSQNFIKAENTLPNFPTWDEIEETRGKVLSCLISHLSSGSSSILGLASYTVEEFFLYSFSTLTPSDLKREGWYHTILKIVFSYWYANKMLKNSKENDYYFLKEE